MADTFINKTEFYERIGPVLDKIDTELYWAARSISSEAEKAYCHKELQAGINLSIMRVNDARAMIRDIHGALQEVKTSKRMVSVNRDEKRIMRLSVIKGGEPIKKGGKG